MKIEKIPQLEQEYSIVLTESELKAIRIVFGSSNEHKAWELSCYPNKSGLTIDKFKEAFRGISRNLFRLFPCE